MRRLLSTRRKKPPNCRALKLKWGNSATEGRMALCSNCWWRMTYGERLSFVHMSLPIHLPGITLMRLILEESSELQPGWTEVSEEWEGRNLWQFVEDSSEEKNWHLFERYCKVKSGEGIGNPLQHPCLENPMDRGAWWAAVHTESDTTEVTCQACMHWRRKWQSTPVSLPGESRGQRSLVGCRLWGRTELDTTEET